MNRKVVLFFTVVWLASCWVVFAPEARSSEEITTVSEEQDEGFSDGVMCIICMEMFPRLQPLPCRHGFCKVCCEGMRRHRHLTCPLCRAPMDGHEESGSERPEHLSLDEVVRNRYQVDRRRWHHTWEENIRRLGADRRLREDDRRRLEEECRRAVEEERRLREVDTQSLAEIYGRSVQELREEYQLAKEEKERLHEADRDEWRTQCEYATRIVDAQTLREEQCQEEKAKCENEGAAERAKWQDMLSQTIKVKEKYEKLLKRWWTPGDVLICAFNLVFFAAVEVYKGLVKPSEKKQKKFFLPRDNALKVEGESLSAIGNSGDGNGSNPVEAG